MLNSSVQISQLRFIDLSNCLVMFCSNWKSSHVSIDFDSFEKTCNSLCFFSKLHEILRSGLQCNNKQNSYHLAQISCSNCQHRCNLWQHHDDQQLLGEEQLPRRRPVQLETTFWPFYTGLQLVGNIQWLHQLWTTHFANETKIYYNGRTDMCFKTYPPKRDPKKLFPEFNFFSASAISCAAFCSLSAISN